MARCVVIQRLLDTGTIHCRRHFHGDAAFASPEVYEFLEDGGLQVRHPGYPANKALHDSIAAPTQALRRSAAERSSPVLRELQLSGR